MTLKIKRLAPSNRSLSRERIVPKRRKVRLNWGYSLIELLVVISVFGIITLVATNTLISILRSSKKSEAITKIHQDLAYATGAMQRQLRSAKSIKSTCDDTGYPQISFIDQNSNLVTFVCDKVNTEGLPSSIASISGTLSDSLTSSNITITNCSITCTPSEGNAPPYVTIEITATDLSNQNALVSVTTEATLRSY